MTDTKSEWVEECAIQAHQNFVHAPWEQVFALIKEIQPKEEFAKKLQSWMIHEIHNLPPTEQTEFKTKMNAIIELPPMEFVINEIVHPTLGTIRNIVWKSKTTWGITFDALVLFGCDHTGFRFQSPSFDEIKDLKFTTLQQFRSFICNACDRNMYLHSNLSGALQEKEHQKNHKLIRELKYVQRLSDQHNVSCRNSNKLFGEWSDFYDGLEIIHTLIPQIDGEKCDCRGCSASPDDSNKPEEPFSWSAFILS